MPSIYTNKIWFKLGYLIIVKFNTGKKMQIIDIY